MNISPISFGSAKFTMYFPDKKDKQGQKEFEKEIKTAHFAREANVSVPVYKAVAMKNHSLGFKYEVKGDPADPIKNPIGTGHLHNLFKNLYYLDKAGIYHNDLDTAHVFFSGSEKVELDCFRYAQSFEAKGGKIVHTGIRTPDFAVPSNAEGFEYANLGAYVSKIKNEDKKDDFISNYLKAKSHYHAKREQMLLDEGFNPDDDVVRYEHIQSVVFKDPSKEVVDYTKDKLELNHTQREAFTSWDEGGGACGQPVNPIKRFNGVLGYLTAMRQAAFLKNKASDYSSNCKSKEEGEYFKFEEKYSDYRMRNLHNDTRGMACWTFNDNKLEGGLDIFLGKQSEKAEFEKFFDKIDIESGDLEQLDDDVQDAGAYYLLLAQKWTPELNQRYRDAYYTKLGRFPKV